jgi:hypothetical protein
MSKELKYNEPWKFSDIQHAHHSIDGRLQTQREQNYSFCQRPAEMVISLSSGAV